MDTKSKNNKGLQILIGILIILTVSLPSIWIVGEYGNYRGDAGVKVENQRNRYAASEEFMQSFVEFCYITNAKNTGTEKERKKFQKDFETDEFSNWRQNYEQLFPYADYQMEDAKENVIAGGLSENDYAYSMYVSFDKNGAPTAHVSAIVNQNKMLLGLRSALVNFDAYLNNMYEDLDDEELYKMEKPRNCTFVFGMTEKNFQIYLDERLPVDYKEEVPQAAFLKAYGLLAAVAFLAMLYSRIPVWKEKKEKIFHAPMELALGVLIFIGALLPHFLYSRIIKSEYTKALDVISWIVIFSAVCWSIMNLCRIFDMGIKEYLKQYCLCYQQSETLRDIGEKTGSACKKGIHKITFLLESVDFRKSGNRYVLKLVVINALLLSVCHAIFSGTALIWCDSIVMFLILRRWYRRVQIRYVRLLNAEEALAEGNLNVEIPQYLGVFQALGETLGKIQKGFRTAVEEEVKSQRLKTELITNVSHDLKTPLTAIITYVDLLKQEKDPEKQKEYIEVLERKSMRLKVLIEDLFEVSKANSQSVKLDIVELDIVNLFKQVKLELEEQIQKSEVIFRCEYPEEKLMVALDSQKTYRIFENLLVNITKYAMPHTRAYIQIRREDAYAVVDMKNVSAEELHVRPEELTERFVRGDASRKTEGAGLGLAIVSSFVELQKGSVQISTDADLFKVTLRFPLVAH